MWAAILGVATFPWHLMARLLMRDPQEHMVAQVIWMKMSHAGWFAEILQGTAFRKQHYTGLNHFWCLKTWEKDYAFSLKKFNIQNAVEDFALLRTNPGQQKVQHAGTSFSPCLLTAGSWWGVTACSCLHGGLVTLAVLWWNLWWESKVGELLKIAACVAFGWSCLARSW